MINETPLSLKPETLTKIKDLQRANLDAADALHAAKAQVESQMLDVLFGRIESARNDNAKELAGYLSLNDEEPIGHGTASGKLRKSWVNFRGALNRGDPHVLLIEARRSEGALDEAYRDAIKETTGSAINDVLHRQLAAVVETRRMMESLEELAS